jgi:hypothetical protein
MKKINSILFLWWLLFSSGHVGITWETQKFVMEIEEDATEQAIIFTGKNLTDEPIHIESVKADCGCVDIFPSTTEVMPGSVVVVKGVIRISQTDDKIEKNVLITTGSKEGNLEKLSIELTKKRRVAVSPRVLLWKQRQKATVQKLIIKLQGFGSKISLIDIRSDFINRAVQYW